jgi:sensor histidine kinase YesM
MRFKEEVEIEIYIASLIDDTVIAIPPMLLQPFVENVFVHAFDESHPFPKRKISFEIVDDRVLVCKVIDNGKGLNAHKQSKFHESRGIALARARIVLLQLLNVDPIQIDFTKSDGTTVTIRFFV